MFKISRHQYDLIMQQAQACYPEEAGGILGGKDGIVMGILPIPNQYLYDRTKTFGMTNDDMERGYRFLEKYGLEFYGIYHSHPKGIAYPSDEDLSHGHRFLFIISLSDRYNPELRAWQAEGGQVSPAPIEVVSDSGFTVLELDPNRPKLSQAGMVDEIDRLAQTIEDIKSGKIKPPPGLIKTDWDSSTFSAMA